VNRRVLIAACVVAVVAAALAVFAVLDVAHAIMLAAAAIAAIILNTAPPGRAEPWPRPPVEIRRGARSDVSSLAWDCLGRDGRVTERAARRIRMIAVRRLAAHGVVWDGAVAQPGADPDGGWGPNGADAAWHRLRAAQLLGSRVLASMTRAGTATPRTVETWFAALDRLDALSQPADHAHVSTLDATVRSLP
jgi:hypothetical protein